MAYPRISVIMSVYNGEKYLREAIESILNQTFADFEFLIVNDGSTDGSLEIIQSYPDERIRVINNEQNIGLTKSLNRAIRQARGEFIARQDADDISLPNRFEEQIKYFDQHPETAMLGTSKYVIDEDGKILRQEIALLKPRSKNLLKTNVLTHGAVMFRKTIVDELGAYNEVLRYSQDYELWLRIAKHYEVRNLRQQLYKSRSHSANIRLMNWEEATLYHLLALRLGRGELEDEVLKTIKDKGIKSLHSYLTKNEDIFFHRSIASFLAQQGNLKLAREEYKKVFSLIPFNIKNNINIIRSYFGRRVMTKSSEIYETIRNFCVHLENWYSK